MPDDGQSFPPEDRAVARLRACHEPGVRRNELKLESRWKEACCAYNLHIRPGRHARQRLAEIQDSILRLEPTLLRVPEHALHISVAWLLPVHEQFPVAKEVLWEDRGAAWWEKTRQVLGRLGPFTLRYTSVLATASAIIALAEPTDVLRTVRREIAAALGLRWDLFRGDLTHTTMFRYGQPLAQPTRLLTELAGAALCIELPVDQIYLVREDIFPSLEAEVLSRFQFAPATRAAGSLTGPEEGRRDPSPQRRQL
jgi:hypothetical protein